MGLSGTQTALVLVGISVHCPGDSVFPPHETPGTRQREPRRPAQCLAREDVWKLLSDSDGPIGLWGPPELCLVLSRALAPVSCLSEAAPVELLRSFSSRPLGVVSEGPLMSGCALCHCWSCWRPRVSRPLLSTGLCSFSPCSCPAPRFSASSFPWCGPPVIPSPVTRGHHVLHSETCA